MHRGLMRKSSVEQSGILPKKAQENGIERTALLVVGNVLDPEKGGHVRSYLYS